MATNLAKIVADFNTTITTKNAVGDTTSSIASVTNDDGIAIADGVYYFTIDKENSDKEFIQATITGTSLASIKTLSRNGTLVSGFARVHRVGATVEITDFGYIKMIMDLLDGTTDLNASVPLKYDGTATISNANMLATKAYADALAIAGSPDSTTTTKGIVKMSVAPASAASPIAVGDNDPRVPTTGENDAMAGGGNLGTPSSSNKYETQNDTATTSTADKLVRALASGKIDSSFIEGLALQTFTYGETITAGMPVYLKQSDSKVYKASASNNNEALSSTIGIAYESGVNNDSKRVAMLDSGMVLTGLSLGNATATISETADQTQGTGGTQGEQVYTGNPSKYHMWLAGEKVANLTKLDIYLSNITGSGAGVLTVNIYPVTIVSGVPTIGSTVGSATVNSPTANAVNVFTPASPLTLVPGQMYAWQLTAASGSGSHSWNPEIRSSGASLPFNKFTSGGILEDSVAKFTTYYTAVQNWQAGDNIFLGDTAGSIAVAKSGGAKKLILGKIISASSIVLQRGRGDLLLSSTTFPMNANYTNRGIVPIPKNCSRIVVYSEGVYASGTDMGHVFDFRIGDQHTLVVKDNVGSNIYVTTTISPADLYLWIQMATSSAGYIGTSDNATVYFYR